MTRQIYTSFVSSPFFPRLVFINSALSFCYFLFSLNKLILLA